METDKEEKKMGNSMDMSNDRRWIRQALRSVAVTALLLMVVLLSGLAGTIEARAEVVTDETQAVASYTDPVNGTVMYNTVKEAIDRANAESGKGTKGGVVKLLQDYKHQVVKTGSNDDEKNDFQFKSSLVLDGTYILDLNGKSLSIAGQGWTGMSVLFVKSGTISLINSNPDKQGEIIANGDNCYRGIQICKDAHLEIGGSKDNSTLQSYEIQIYGSQFAVVFYDEGAADYVAKTNDLTVNEKAVVCFIGGTNTLRSNIYRDKSALQIRKGTCEILRGTNIFTTTDGTRMGGNTCSISDEGKLSIKGGINTFNGEGPKNSGEKGYVIGLVVSTQDDVNCYGTLEISGGTTTLKGGGSKRTSQNASHRWSKTRQRDDSNS